MKYLVRWEIDIEADTPREAAEQARALQLDPGSWATVYVVSEGGREVAVHLTDVDATLRGNRPS